MIVTEMQVPLAIDNNNNKTLVRLRKEKHQKLIAGEINKVSHK